MRLYLLLFMCVYWVSRVNINSKGLWMGSRDKIQELGADLCDKWGHKSRDIGSGGEKIRFEIIILWKTLVEKEWEYIKSIERETFFSYKMDKIGILVIIIIN